MRSIAQIMATARELWPLYLTVVLGAVATSATALLTPFVIARATDTVVEIAEGRGGTVADLMWLAVILLIIALANSAITNISGYFGDLMSVRLRAILSAKDRNAGWRSTSVTSSAGASWRRWRAAARPPQPPPTMTTRRLSAKAGCSRGNSPAAIRKWRRLVIGNAKPR